MRQLSTPLIGRLRRSGLVVVVAGLLVAALGLGEPARATPADLDFSFGGDGVVFANPTPENDTLQRVVIQPDGAIVVAGTTGTAYRDIFVARYQPNGALDPGFAGGGMVVIDLGSPGSPTDDQAGGLALQSDGRIVVAGQRGRGGGDFAVIRLTPSGTLDATFGTGGIVTTSFGATSGVTRVAVDGSGRILAAGLVATTSGSSSSNAFALARYTSSGALDANFGQGGKIVDTAGYFPTGLAVQADSKPIVVGPSSIVGTDPAVVIRYDSDGRRDASFGNGGATTIDAPAGGLFLADLTLDRSGRLLAAGNAGNSGMVVYRVLADGRPDPAFGSGGKALLPIGSCGGGAQAVTEDPFGKVVLGGSGCGQVVVARLSSSGTADSGFGSGGYRQLSLLGTSEGALGVAVDASARILAAGHAGSSDGQGFVLRLAGGEPPATAGPPASSSPPAPRPAPAPPARSGYWMVGSTGSVYAFGDAQWFGNAPVGRHSAIDLEPTSTGRGYWIVDDVGDVYTHGDARYFGGNPGLRPFESVTSISSTPTGDGYWLFTSFGRVLAYGNAIFLGDMSSVRLNGPVLDSVPTPSGRGYFMVAADGGIFTFGDATFAGSMGGVVLNQPVQSLVPDPDGGGYWLVASDGGIFAFDAQFYGSMGAIRLNRPVTGMVGYASGYLMVAEDGGIFSFGDAPFAGSLGADPPAHPIVSVAVLHTP